MRPASNVSQSNEVSAIELLRNPNQPPEAASRSGTVEAVTDIHEAPTNTQGLALPVPASTNRENVKLMAACWALAACGAHVASWATLTTLTLAGSNILCLPYIRLLRLE